MLINIWRMAGKSLYWPRELFLFKFPSTGELVPETNEKRKLYTRRGFEDRSLPSHCNKSWNDVLHNFNHIAAGSQALRACMTVLHASGVAILVMTLGFARLYIVAFAVGGSFIGGRFNSTFTRIQARALCRGGAFAPERMQASRVGKLVPHGGFNLGPSYSQFP